MPNPFVPKPNYNLPSNMNQIQTLYHTLMNAKNPTQMFIQLAQQNPQLKPIADALKQGGNPQAIFKQMCEQRGINPDDFLKQIQGNNTNSR